MNTTRPNIPCSCCEAVRRKMIPGSLHRLLLLPTAACCVPAWSYTCVWVLGRELELPEHELEPVLLSSVQACGVTLLCAAKFSDSPDQALPFCLLAPPRAWCLGLGGRSLLGSIPVVCQYWMTTHWCLSCCLHPAQCITVRGATRPQNRRSHHPLVL